MNERLKQRRARAKDMQEYHLARAWEGFLKEGGHKLRAKTTKAAKQQCKRLFTLGCFIKGFVTVTNTDLTGREDTYPECIYECAILPQGSKQPGGRSAFSNREEHHLKQHKLKAPPLKWIKPEWFEVEMYN